MRNEKSFLFFIFEEKLRGGDRMNSLNRVHGSK